MVKTKITNAVKLHVTVEPKLIKALDDTAKCLREVNRLLKLNGEGLVKLFKGSLKVVQEGE